MRYRDAFFREIPGERQIFDLGTRTDGQPVYAGHAPLGTPTSAPDWTMSFFKYNEAGIQTEVYSLKGAWDSRVVIFLEYV